MCTCIPQWPIYTTFQQPFIYFKKGFMVLLFYATVKVWLGLDTKSTCLGKDHGLHWNVHLKCGGGHIRKVKQPLSLCNSKHHVTFFNGPNRSWKWGTAFSCSFCHFLSPNEQSSHTLNPLPVNREVTLSGRYLNSDTSLKSKLHIVFWGMDL